MENICIIDIGSNSVRMVIVTVDHGTYRFINDLKETVRMAEGMEVTGLLSEDRMIQAIKTLSMFKNMAEALQVNHTIAVATEAVRRAKNRDDFISRAYAATGIEISVLDGKEEAYYDYLGVVNSIGLNEGLIMDMGGASTELIWFSDRQLRESVSLPWGSLNLTQRFNLRGRIQPEHEAELYSYLHKMLAKVKWLKKVAPAPIIGVGGTMRNLGKIHRRQTSYPLDITHNYAISAREVNQIYDLVKSKTPGERRKIRGLSPERADIFAGACGAVAKTLDYCGIDHILISGSGLREGLLYNYLSGDKPLPDVLGYSIHNILTNNHLNETHAHKVYQLTQSLFEQLSPLHGLGNNQHNIIKTAALLHDLGVAVRYYGHPKHSFYMIINSPIKGLSHRELLLSAYIAAAHTKEETRADITTYSPILSPDDLIIVQKIGILLKIAESLDRSNAGIIERVQCHLQEQAVIIQTHSAKPAELEIYDALQWAPQFKRLYQRDLLII